MEIINFLTSHLMHSCALLTIGLLIALNEYGHPERKMRILSPQNLVALLNHLHPKNQKKTVLVDLRPVEKYTLGHITGAISLPAEHLKHSYQSISAWSEISKALPKTPSVLVLLQETGLAVAFRNQFTQLGHELAYLEGGVNAWQQAGFPLVKN